ncbi:CTD phosphatase Fcp1, partial [Friedmanniomyces endolithicus]
MADLKSSVLAGVHLVFSGVVPLGVDIHSHDLSVWARSFGATVSDNVGKRTTHLIASPDRRTAKVRQAAKKGGRIAV